MHLCISCNALPICPSFFFNVSLSVFLTCVHLLFSNTGFALYMAAPSDLAVAGEGGEAEGCVVAPPTAQAAAAGVFGTGPAGRAGRVTRGPAEAGRLLQEHQLCGSWSRACVAVSTWPRQLGLARGGVGDAVHADCGVVTVLQQVARVVKRGELLPASPHGARTGDAVTLTSSFESALHCLKERQKSMSIPEKKGVGLIKSVLSSQK